ncbi:hypothetical protein [Mameliella sp.]|uniref:hypothetical protein n=1 Tax=Mameliella sp. TaxID=1924940 RepID=UPI003B504ADE
MKPDEANARIRGLDRVTDICATDPERIEALRAEISRLSANRQGLLDMFRRL